MLKPSVANTHTIDPLHAGILARLLTLAVLWLALCLPMQSSAAVLEYIPSDPLGRWMDLLIEQGQPLTINDAISRQREGHFARNREAVPKFGIGAKPVWLYMTTENTGAEPAERYLQLEISWLDRIDVYVVHQGEVLKHRIWGDTVRGAPPPVAGLGYVFDLTLPPGESEIFVRVATADPMLLPVRLLDATQLGNLQRQYDYGYGLLYGFLLALLAYNAMLYIGLKERSYLDYVLYVGAFAILNLSYTGHGFAWLWSGNTVWQQYAIPIFMVIIGCLGLRFADGFLNLKEHAPSFHLFVRWLSICGLLGITVTILGQQQSVTVLIAFLFVLVFSTVMVILGVIAIRHGQIFAYYFLAAALSAMFGNTVTALAVWIGLPYSPIAFHAAGWGVVIEGILLALALAYRMRQYQRAQNRAAHLARTDQLTGLLNRRAFLEHALPIWNLSRRNERPLSVMMVDIDHFKKINDTHGHAMGDRALQSVSTVLMEICRNSDIIARWGGEEFVILLPETNGEQATQLGERLRAKIAALRLGTLRSPIRLSASFGIADRTRHESLEQLINEADEWLYRAKQSGRNRVAGNSLMPSR